MLTLIKLPPIEIKLFYEFYECLYGRVLLASTQTGLSFASINFTDKIALQELKKYLPYAELIQQKTKIHQLALEKISNSENKIHFNLEVKASDFQFKVWNELLKIPYSKTTTYSKIALQLQLKNASRAVGNAVGKNPIAFIIPCHRVIQASGNLSGYRWGAELKKKLLQVEVSLEEGLFSNV